MADVSYGSLPFAEQIAFFRRKVNVNTQSWLDVWQQAHDHAFMVAGANRDDLVLDFRQAVDAAIANGETLEQFRKRFDSIVAKYGWDYNGGRNWRSRVIYETNLRTSYAAGRWQQLQSIKQRVPYWEYVHSDAVQHPRPQHLAWNGLVLSADDPWWHSHFPPNGWGCQCTVRGRSKRDLADMGKSGPDQAPPLDMQQVTIGQRSPGGPRDVETPAGVDPGFGYAPGRDAWLREQAQRAIEAESAAPNAWVTEATDNAASMRLPAIPNAMPAPVPLGMVVTDAGVASRDAAALLGGATRVFNVHGLPVTVDAETMGPQVAAAGADSALLPLVIDAAADPAEVWIAPQTAQAGDATRLRTMLVKRYALADGSNVTLLVEVERGVVVRWRAVPDANIAPLDDARSGLLWYGGGYGRRTR